MNGVGMRTVDLFVVAFIAWRVLGLAATVVALVRQSYAERRAAQWCETFARFRAEDYRQAGLLMRSGGWTVDEVARAFSRLGRAGQ